MPSEKGTHALTRPERLALQADFKTVFSEGVRIRADKFDIRYRLRQDMNISRLGLSVSRAVGMATLRNTLKRMTREWFRLNKHRFKPSVDLVFCLRSVFKKADVLSFRKKIEEMLKPIL